MHPACVGEAAPASQSGLKKRLTEMSESTWTLRRQLSATVENGESLVNVQQSGLCLFETWWRVI